MIFAATVQQEASFNVKLLHGEFINTATAFFSFSRHKNARIENV